MFRGMAKSCIWWFLLAGCILAILFYKSLGPYLCLYDPDSGLDGFFFDCRQVVLDALRVRGQQDQGSVLVVVIIDRPDAATLSPATTSPPHFAGTPPVPWIRSPAYGLRAM
jgi:hypothetical protein